MSPLALSLHFLQAQPDRRLVELARQGHEPAFEALVHRYRKELLAYCRRLQPRSGGAEDALQQALLQAWKALKAGAEVRDVRPWLYRIAHNVTVSHLRVPPAVPQEMSESGAGPEVHQLVEQRLRARAALAGVAALPALQRDVFVSTTLDGASHDEVATALGLSSGAIRGLIYRARATLRSAAAAFVPSPVVHWAIRRAETQGAGARAVEAIAGGGGAGVAAMIVKSGAVLTVAGAVAGAGGAILSQRPAHHRSIAKSAALSASHAHGDRIAGGAAGVVRDAAAARAAASIHAAEDGRHGGSSEARRQEGRRADPDDRGGSVLAGTTGEDRGRSPAGSSGASSVATRDGGDGGSTIEVTTASSDGGSGGTSGGSGGSSGGSDGGGTSGSSDGSNLTTSTSGSDGGTTDGGSGTSAGQLTTAQAASDGGSGLSGGGSSSVPDGGGSSGSTSSSGSNDTTTTSGSH